MPPVTTLDRTLDRFMQQLMLRWNKDIGKVNKRLDTLHPSTNLPPIPSPQKGGVGCKREVNVACALRDAVETANATIADGEEKYIQFPEGYTDKKLNSDAKDSLDILMLRLIGVDYGKLNWKTASRTTHIEQCEAVIRTAAASRDFLVFRQTAFLWAIRDLAEQKMKSKGRGAVPSDDNGDPEGEFGADIESPAKRVRLGEDVYSSNGPIPTVPEEDASDILAAIPTRGRGRGTTTASRGRGRGRGTATASRGRGRGRGIVSLPRGRRITTSPLGRGRGLTGPSNSRGRGRGGRGARGTAHACGSDAA